MEFFTARRVVSSLALLGAAVLLAQDWQTATTLPTIDFTGLSAAKKTTALRLMRNYACPCGCEEPQHPGEALVRGVRPPHTPDHWEARYRGNRLTPPVGGATCEPILTNSLTIVDDGFSPYIARYGSR